MFIEIFILLFIFQLKHFLADYPLQTLWMLGKFKDGWDFIPPLLSHVSVHGIFTLIICLFVRPELWWLALVDMTIHFFMDRIKAGKKYLGRFEALSKNEYLDDKLDYNVCLDMSKKCMEENDIDGFRYYKSQKDYIDRKFKNNTYFWWALGLDQAIHHFTHYFIIWMLVC